MLGENVKKRREELGYSQDYLASLLGYKSRSSIQKIEKGENDIPQSKLKKFADALKTTPAHLIGAEKKSANNDGLSVDKTHIIEIIHELNDYQAKLARTYLELLIQKDNS